MNYEQSANQSPSPYEVAPTELRNIARLAIHALDHPLMERALSPDEMLIDADGQTVTVGSLTIDTTQAEQPSLLKTIGVETFAMTHTPACYELHSDIRYPEMISIATKRYHQTESVYYLISIEAEQATILTEGEQSLLIGFKPETGQLADPLADEEGVRDAFLPEMRPVVPQEALELRSLLHAVTEYQR